MLQYHHYPPPRNHPSGGPQDRWSRYGYPGYDQYPNKPYNHSRGFGWDYGRRTGPIHDSYSSAHNQATNVRSDHRHRNTYPAGATNDSFREEDERMQVHR